MKVTFAIGDRIELMHIKSAIGRKVSDKKYGSQLLDFDGDRTAKIAMPISEGKVIPLEIDDDYNLCFFTNSGLYQCTARIKKRYTENRMYVMDVIFLTPLKKFQMRKFYRLDCSQFVTGLFQKSSLKRKMKRSRTKRKMKFCGKKVPFQI